MKFIKKEKDIKNNLTNQSKSKDVDIQIQKMVYKNF